MMLSKSALTLFLLSLNYGRAQDPLMMAQQGLAAGAEAIIEHQQAHPNEEVEGVILVHTEPQASGDAQHHHSEGAQQHAQEHEKHRHHLFHHKDHHEKGAHSNDHVEHGHAASRDDSGSNTGNHEQAAQGGTQHDQSNKNQGQDNSAQSHQDTHARQGKENAGHEASDNASKQHGRKTGASTSGNEANADHDVSMREDIPQTKYTDHDKDFVTTWEDMPNNIQLTDANFEHETQASTGSTTGSWLFSYNFPPAKPVTVQGQLPEPAYWYDRNIVLGQLKPPAPVTLKRLGLSKSHEQGGNGLVFLQPGGTFHVLPHKEGTNLRWSEILDFCKNPSTTTTNNDTTKAPGNKIAPVPGFLGHFKQMFHKFTGSPHGKGFLPMLTTGFLPLLTTALALLTAIGVYKSMTGGNKARKYGNKVAELSKNFAHKGSETIKNHTHKGVETNKNRVAESNVPQTKTTNKVEATHNVKQTQPSVDVKVVKKGVADNTKQSPPHLVETHTVKTGKDFDKTNQNESYVYDVQEERVQ